MELKLFSSLVVDSAKDKGDIAIANAPVAEGSALPTQGFHAYHNTATGLLKSLRSVMLAAMKAKKVVATVEITVSDLKKYRTGYSENSSTYLKPEDVAENDALMLHLISAPMRNELIDVISARVTDESLKNELAAITADRYLLNFVKKHPQAIDYIHEHPKYAHFKAIVYPVGTESQSFTMAALYNLSPEQVKVRLMHPFENINPVLPASVFENADAVQKLSTEFEANGYKP